MTTRNPTSSQGKSRERHSAEPVRKASRPLPQGGDESSSADDIREAVKESVSKGVAAVAGAAEGLDETLTETHLADTAESAVRQVGDTATRVVRAAKETTEDLKEAFRGEGGTGLGTGDEAQTEDDDFDIERNDPTFRSKPGARGPGAYDLGETEANTSGETMESEGMHGSAYNEDDPDRPSQGI